MSNNHLMPVGLAVPFIAQDNMTRVRHSITHVTDTPSGRWYWIGDNRYEASRFTVIPAANSNSKAKPYGESLDDHAILAA